MKRVSLTVLFAILVFPCLVIALPPAVISQKSSPQAVANGKRIFDRSCSGCHDTLGTSARSGPSLKHYYRRQPRPVDASVRSVIQQGKGKMPAFSSLSRLETDNLVAYLKTL